MNRFICTAALVAVVAASTAAVADTGVVTGDRGETYEIVTTRALPNDMRGAAVEIVSTSGVMVMEYGFDCASDRYSYLGMMHDRAGLETDEPAITKLQGDSDSIIGDNLRGVTLTPVSDDPLDEPIRELMARTCS